ncbi:hypothetical protein [Bradyrhizobium sp. 157]|uniref:hypothetical protein n=1 Tax=Bradyrhizobium sp. 157 TaxID=2782631 RepID=UPI001FF7F20B|nr:hypothetical protein [Bradyrhizobium sp. 157]
MKGITLRPAAAEDAAAIGAVFDAAVRAAWTYLGELNAKPMFAPRDWDQLVAEHMAPNVFLVAVDEPRTSSATQRSIPKTARCFFSSFTPATPVAVLGALCSLQRMTPCGLPGAGRLTCSSTSRTNGL